MNRRGSILWILFLLAAMFLGPSMLLRQMNAAATSAERERILRPNAEKSELRLLIEQEKLIDAPASLPTPSLNR